MSSGVYAIVNKINYNMYIGSAINIKARWRVHRSRLRKGEHHSKHLQGAWNKYGEDNFNFIVLAECDENNILKYEQYYLSEINPTYNTNPVAGNMSGFKHSDESRKKLSVSKTGFRHTEESKKKMSKIWSGRPRGKYTEERCRKISEAHKGKKINENQKRGLSIGQHSKISDETKRKISEAQKGYAPTEETRAKLRLAWERRKQKMASDGECSNRPGCF